MKLFLIVLSLFSTFANADFQVENRLDAIEEARELLLDSQQIRVEKGEPIYYVPAVALGVVAAVPVVWASSAATGLLLFNAAEKGIFREMGRRLLFDGVTKFEKSFLVQTTFLNPARILKSALGTTGGVLAYAAGLALVTYGSYQSFKAARDEYVEVTETEKNEYLRLLDEMENKLGALPQ